MRLFHALCATLGALLIVSTLPSGAYAADGPTLSEAFVLTKDGQLVDTLTLIDPSRTMSESACQPYAGKSSDQHVEFVTRDDATVCHMQLMYTNAENESEFSLEDSGEFVMTAHAERTLTESRKLFHPDLTLKSLSLSVEGEVQSATAGASTSATTYEGRTFSVTSWTDTVPQMITVKGSLTPGGDPSAAATTNALKDPWGVTPMPTSASASSSVAPTADAAAAPEESSDPPIALLIGLIVGLVLLVIGIVVVVYVVRAKRGKKATSGTQAATPASHIRGPSPARGNEGVEHYAPPTPIAPAATSAPAPAPTKRPSASLNPPQPTPRDTGFTWEHKSRPMPTAAPVAATPEAPKRRRSRKDHRPAVFPERPAQPMAGQPMPGAGMSSGPLQVPMTGVSQRSAVPAAPPASLQAPAVAPTPATTPTPTQASQPVVTVPQAVASAPQRETHTESASDSSLRRRSRQASEAQQAADAQPVFPSRRSQRQVVRDAHVPQPIPAPEEAPAAQQVPIPVPMPPVPPVPPPPASAVDAPETMLIPKVRQAAIPVPEPVVEPEPVAVVEPKPVAVVEPEPVAEPEPIAVVEPEPIVEPEPVAVVEPEPIVEPEPVAVVEPEPVVAAEPEPVIEPEPVVAAEPDPIVEPEPIIEPEPIVAPDPVVEPEPVAEPAPASSMLFIDDAEMPTAQIRRVRRERPADWGTPEPAAPVQQPEPAPQVSTPPMTPAPFEQSAPAMPSVVEQPQAPASPQMPAAFQAPAAATPFQEDWNAEISQKKEAPREQEGDKKRRGLWGWGKRRKKRNEAATAPEPEIDEPIESSHAPMISVDAQDEDDWNDWQNWNSRS